MFREGIRLESRTTTDLQAEGGSRLRHGGASPADRTNDQRLRHLALSGRPLHSSRGRVPLTTPIGEPGCSSAPVSAASRPSSSLPTSTSRSSVTRAPRSTPPTSAGWTCGASRSWSTWCCSLLRPAPPLGAPVGGRRVGSLAVVPRSSSSTGRRKRPSREGSPRAPAGEAIQRTRAG